MITSKHINRICIAVIAIMLVITLLCLSWKSLGIQASASSLGYENRLFDRSRVHTIDIVMDDWDELIENATSETYYYCKVVIDGEAFGNVAIRGKGNTSLSSVAQMDSERYSFKLEFDHYQNGNTYYGLDKLCLNNIIQDNTYMKDYLAYVMMNEFGVTSPLCSYAYVTVNGKDWGLYLAVEGVEDSFLERNYNGAGDLYKPDSMMGGGGRGNGRDFDMDKWKEENGFGDSESENAADREPSGENSSTPDFGGDIPGGNMPDFGGDMPDFDGSFSGGNIPDSGNGSSDSNSSAGNRPGGSREGKRPGGNRQGSTSGNMPGFDGNFPGGVSGNGSGFPGGGMPNFGGGMPNFGGGFPGGGFGGMNGDSVKLQYIDDNASSYGNIFDNAKTDVSEGDKKRLIASLKSLNSYEDLENILNIEEVMRYFVVHGFVVNGDSYTGNMVHNYYLHEQDGKLEMIPWDYNLGYGTFMGNNASDAVNDPIDSPVSGGNTDDRPMVGWIFSDESYTELYHQYYEEFAEQFISSGKLLALIDETAEMIAPYVEKDPTAFCTYEEFEAGVKAIRSFCEQRGQSIIGQLEGTIPSTENGQQADSSALIDTGDLNLQDMGTMGGGKGGFGGFGDGNNRPEMPEGFDGSDRPEMPGSFNGFGNGNSRPDKPEGSGGRPGNMPEPEDQK